METMRPSTTQFIRNFCIIAHIDHGKSTLADRLLEFTHTIDKRLLKDRQMDTLELEQERGITIKLQTARMLYEYGGSKNYPKGSYILNLIDTPGHVDFSYEVSRSLAACEGAILLIDATQGIQAQTLTTFYQALELNLSIIPAISKIDLPIADVAKTKKALIDVFGFEEKEIILTSGKTGEGIDQLLSGVIEQVKEPKVYDFQETKALIFDSYYDDHKGVIAMVKVISGTLHKNDKMYALVSDLRLDPVEIGYLHPHLDPQDVLLTGEVGFIATGLKDIRAIHVGDTITKLDDYQRNKDIDSIPGYKRPKPMVFASLYPIEADMFEDFSKGLEKLALNDASLSYRKESSVALGIGYSCGFLGLLHLEITQERLYREFGIELITTVPSVEYHIKLTTTDFGKIKNINTANVTKDSLLLVRSAAEFPDQTFIEYILEPYVRLEILTPDSFIGPLMDLAQSRRGIYKSMEYLSQSNDNSQRSVMLHYEIPAAEIITDFFDLLKSYSQGYASMDYNPLNYRKSDIVKVSVLVNAEPVEALSFLSHQEYARERGKNLVSKLKEMIPKQQFKIPIQASIGADIIAREDISALRKDVTAKLYGGDITRKMKVLERQKKGKAKLKKFGKVSIPKEAFLAALRKD